MDIGIGGPHIYHRYGNGGPHIYAGLGTGFPKSGVPIPHDTVLIQVTALKQVGWKIQDKHLHRSSFKFQ